MAQDDFYGRVSRANSTNRREKDSKMDDTLKCLICGSDRIVNILPGRYRCKNCATAFEKQDGSLSKTSNVESIESVYFNSKINLFKHGLRSIRKLLSPAGAQKLKLLDVGSGFGYFLELANSEFFEAQGVEIYQKAIEHARKELGLKVYDKPLNQLSLPANSYDVVTLWNVLDVFPDPLAEMKEIFRVLKPGGIIYLRVNNFDFHFFSAILGESAAFKLLGLKPGILHRWGINRRSLKTILERSSFENILITNSKPTHGDPYGTGGRLGGFFVQGIKSAYFLFSQLIYFFTLRRVAIFSALVGTARKPA